MNNINLIAKLKNIQSQLCSWLAVGVNTISLIPELTIELENEEKGSSSLPCKAIITIDFKNSMQNDIKLIDDTKKDL